MEIYQIIHTEGVYPASVLHPVQEDAFAVQNAGPPICSPGKVAVIHNISGKPLIPAYAGICLQSVGVCKQPVHIVDIDIDTVGTAFILAIAAAIAILVVFESEDVGVNIADCDTAEATDKFFTKIDHTVITCKIRLHSTPLPMIDMEYPRH